MNKNEIVSIIAKKTGFTKKDADKFIRAFINTITEELTSSGNIMLTSFGSFSVVNKAQRKGRNPITGKTIEISPSKTVRFKPSDILKRIIMNSTNATNQS